MRSAKSIMSTHVITARPTMTCDEVQQLLMINKISGAPVVDSEGHLVGVISVSDILASGLNMGGQIPWSRLCWIACWLRKAFIWKALPKALYLIL